MILIRHNIYLTFSLCNVYILCVMRDMWCVRVRETENERRYSKAVSKIVRKYRGNSTNNQVVGVDAYCIDVSFEQKRANLVMSVRRII